MSHRPGHHRVLVTLRSLLVAGILAHVGVAAVAGKTLCLSSVSFVPADPGRAQVQLWSPSADRSRAIAIFLPHWSAQGIDAPAVFCRRDRISVRVDLTSTTPGTWLVWGTCDLFSLPPQIVTFGSHPLAGLSFDGLESVLTRGSASGEAVPLTAQVTFAGVGPLPDRIAKHAFTIRWSAKALDASLANELAPPETAHTIYATHKPTITAAPVFKQLVDWSTQFAQSLAPDTDDRSLCNALVQNLHRTGLRYGLPAWSTFDILVRGGGMCGGWGRFFRDLAASQGVSISPCAWTLRRGDGTRGWTAIDIAAPGLNNPSPTHRHDFWFVDSRFPRPAWFGQDRTDDDVDYRPARAEYQFLTPDDGHVVAFLKSGDRVTMYDPSFGTGPFEGFAGACVPDGPMDGDALAAFRRVYFDAAVDHIRGRIPCKKEGGVDAFDDLDVKTSLVTSGTDPELAIEWRRLGGASAAPTPVVTAAGGTVSLLEVATDGWSRAVGTIGAAAASVENAVRSGLHLGSAGGSATGSATTRWTWRRTYDRIVRCAESRTAPSAEDLSDFLAILERKAPLDLGDDEPCTGALPPLETLQLAIVRRFRARAPGLSKGIDDLVKRAQRDDYLKQLLDR